MQGDQPQQKRQRRKDARPSEILEAGLALFAERGFAATRLDDVAKRAGIAKGTVYLYFSSKESLFEAALKDRMVSTMEGVGELTASFPGSTEELLGLVLERIYDQMIEGDAGVLLRILISEGERFPHLITLYREVALSRGMATMKAILKRAEARGELRVPAENIDPRMIVAPIAVLAIGEKVFGEQSLGDRDDFLKRHLDLVLRGLLSANAAR
ncbi:TetR/AcrR family transcriptional regulator (plasmid) [Peteryoungia desertarenae]|uniref:TetR/AcrR family transcriptional regulator n=1 Tax=Peteryoungia desertarenae TaxID=1813451 RepID=A0ABX6QTT1_9HYPH|nr:TetR/AcrR family transcriptional regulator [Peteryoungia desertarenae]QLF71605.1 TetR/AcrR family transcriptional regulator [Peteryoungia desertarenae]